MAWIRVIDEPWTCNHGEALLAEADLRPLREQGLSDAAIHDAASVVAYFNRVNRMALGLGVELET